MGSTTITSWREVGRCKGVDPEVFYPEDDEDPGDEAKAICAMCRVRETCLEQAIVVPREDRRVGRVHRPRTAPPRTPAPPFRLNAVRALSSR